jgi:hypothetical protein
VTGKKSTIVPKISDPEMRLVISVPHCGNRIADEAAGAQKITAIAARELVLLTTKLIERSS